MKLRTTNKTSSNQSSSVYKKSFTFIPRKSAMQLDLFIRMGIKHCNKLRWLIKLLDMAGPTLKKYFIHFTIKKITIRVIERRWNVNIFREWQILKLWTFCFSGWFSYYLCHKCEFRATIFVWKESQCHLMTNSKDEFSRCLVT